MVNNAGPHLKVRTESLTENAEGRVSVVSYIMKSSLGERERILIPLFQRL